MQESADLVIFTEEILTFIVFVQVFVWNNHDMFKIKLL